MKILITDDVHPLLIQGLTDAGYTCTYLPNITDEDVRRIISAYTGLIVNSKIKVDKAMMDAAPQLNFVGRLGSGMEIVDRQYAAQKGIAVLSSPEGNRNAVGEHALGMLLALSNNLIRSHWQVKRFDWQREPNRGLELRGCTLGIIGFGHTGSSLAMAVAGLGMDVLVYDKYLPKGYLNGWQQPPQRAFPRFVTEGGVVSRESFGFDEFDHLGYTFSNYQEVEMNDIFIKSDVISFHLPLTDETRYFANQAFFNQCAKPVVIVNTSRGQIVNTADLITALKTGKVKGACLDVFENEKSATYTPQERVLYQTLFAFEQVIVSPHIAGWTHQSKERLASVLLRKILSTLKTL